MSSSTAQTIDQTAGTVMSILQLSPDKRRLIRQHLINWAIEYLNTARAAIKAKQYDPIPQSLVIDFPKDYAGYSKIGWVVDGQVHLVAQNRNIAKILSLNQPGVFTGTPTAYYNNPSGAQMQPPVPIPQNQLLYGSYGGGGTVSGAIIPELNGYFREDWDGKCFRLDPSVNTFPNLYLEYVSNCFEPTAEFLIHPYAYLWAQAYARYNYLSFAYKTLQADIDRAAHELDRAETIAIRKLSGMSVFDIVCSYNKWLAPNE